MKINLVMISLVVLCAAVGAAAQQPEAPPQSQTPAPKVAKPAPPLTFADRIKRYAARVGATVDQTKSSADMVVSNYPDPKGGRVTVVVLNDRRKGMVGFYIYNFGSVKNAPSREEIYKYLLAANDAITIGSFFVDGDEDIGYKYLLPSAQGAISQAEFESAYLTMAAIARERRADIRQILGLTNKKEDGTPEVKKAAEDKPPEEW